MIKIITTILHSAFIKCIIRVLNSCWISIENTSASWPRGRESRGGRTPSSNCTPTRTASPTRRRSGGWVRSVRCSEVSGEGERAVLQRVREHAVQAVHVGGSLLRFFLCGELLQGILAHRQIYAQSTKPMMRCLITHTVNNLSA
jgi:hypothetical protein